jgi:pantoate--beta-alanine ligase
LTSSLPIVRTRAELREIVAGWRAAGRTVGLAPTMGALHAGHLSLIGLAKTQADFAVASLFVNPTQFAPSEDFDAYPRNEQGDAALLAAAGCDLLYAPAVEEIYPLGFATSVTVDGVSSPREGAARPTHFSGVATVVTKLLIQCAADVGVFGEKDFQQLQVIRRLARDLDLPTRIVGAPIIRADDGLALSSRNAYLTVAERAIAPALHRILNAAARSLSSGASVASVEAEGAAAVLAAGFQAVDYFDVRDPHDLTRLGPGPITSAARILATVRLGRTRLLDNVAVSLPGAEVA